MDYLTRAEYEHEALRVMLAVKKELLSKLAKARGVNLLHLEDVLRFWRDFFCCKHLAAEETHLFKLLYQVNHPALEGLAAEHEHLQHNLDELEQISRKLRAGKPNSGREFYEAGERFAAALERHLNRENSIFAELVVNKMQPELAAVPFPPQEEPAELTGLLLLLANLSREYLEKEYDMAWMDRGRTGEIGKKRETAEAVEAYIQEQQDQPRALGQQEQQGQQGQEEQKNHEEQEQEEQSEFFIGASLIEEENGAGLLKNENIQSKKENT